MFFDGWQGIARTALVGVLAYLSLVVLLRVSGKRTLSKMNAFDLVVTVALGSTLATILLSEDVALLEGVTALVVLIAMQFAIAWLVVRSPMVGRLVKSEPTLLVYASASSTRRSGPRCARRESPTWRWWPPSCSRRTAPLRSSQRSKPPGIPRCRT